MISGDAQRLFDAHRREFDPVLDTVFLGELAEITFRNHDQVLIQAVNLLLQLAEPGERNLLLVGFVEGVPQQTPAHEAIALPEPLRTAVANDLGLDLGSDLRSSGRS